MATFSKKTFDAAAYLARRPSYPLSVVENIVDYAKVSTFPSPRLAVDLGCGPGQLSGLLANTNAFDQVIGIDPSAKMIDAANATAGKQQNKLLFQVGSAEELSSIKDESVTIVTSAQAAHWFDHTLVNKELARILRPGGAVAHLGYGEFYMPRHPQVTPVIAKYFRQKLHGYWEGGRIHAEAEFDTVPNADSDPAFDPASFQRIKYNLEESKAYRSDSTLPDVKVTERRPPVLIRNWTVEELQGYLNTASGLHNWNEKHPGQDLGSQFVDEIKQAVGGDWASGRPDVTEKIVWPLTVILSRKKTM